MDEFPIDPDAFVVAWPLFLVIDKTTCHLSIKEGKGIAIGQTGSADFVPLFTDRDLAERFIRRLGNPRLVPEEIVPAEALDLLQELALLEHTHVGFDPTGGPKGSGPCFPIKDVIRALRAQGA
jgi:hypothetical protein